MAQADQGDGSPSAAPSDPPPTPGVSGTASPVPTNPQTGLLGSLFEDPVDAAGHSRSLDNPGSPSTLLGSLSELQNATAQAPPGTPQPETGPTPEQPAQQDLPDPGQWVHGIPHIAEM
jgi:hypothetical protein